MTCRGDTPTINILLAWTELFQISPTEPWIFALALFIPQAGRILLEPLALSANIYSALSLVVSSRLRIIVKLVFGFGPDITLLIYIFRILWSDP